MVSPKVVPGDLIEIHGASFMDTLQFGIVTDDITNDEYTSVMGHDEYIVIVHWAKSGTETVQMSCNENNGTNPHCENIAARWYSVVA